MAGKRVKILVKSRGLTNDISRCHGTNCNRKTTCARNAQLNRDKQDSGLQTSSRWISYIDPLRFGGECDSYILED